MAFGYIPDSTKYKSTASGAKAKLQFMVWGSGAPGAPGAPGLPGLPDDELVVMYSKSEMACFAKGIKFIFQISVLISKCQL